MMDLQVLGHQVVQLESNPRAGLPYWIFWFLVCVILLLLVFIFLRDRNLRRKLNEFFFGARRRFAKLRLQVRIRLEEKKKTQVLRELGEEIWRGDYWPQKGKGLRGKLAAIERKKERIKEQTQQIEKKIFMYKQKLEEMEHHFQLIQTEVEQELIPVKEHLSALQEQEEEILREITGLHHQEEELMRQINTLRQEIRLKEENNSQVESAVGVSKLEKVLTQLVEKKLATRKLVQLKLDQKEVLTAKKESLMAKVESLERKKVDLLRELSQKKESTLQEISKLEDRKEKLLRAFEKLQQDKQPLFISLGELFEAEVATETALMLYAHQLERINRNLQEMKQQMKQL